MGGPGSGGKNKYWTDELIERQLREIAGAIGSFPSVSELRALGKNDLCCIVTKRGGLIAWAEKLGLSRKHSDSDTGWDGEIAATDLFRSAGFECEHTKGVKCSYDMLVNDVLRVDVKTASYAEYPIKNSSSFCRGWFYRIGKRVQADLVFLYQADTGDFYGIPWWCSTTGNMTIVAGGGKWADYFNNWSLVRRMTGTRLAERSQFGMKVSEVA